MRWVHPLYLWLLALAPLLPLALWASRRAARARLRRMGEAPLVESLAREESAPRRLARATLMALGWAGLALALARPQWGVAHEEVTVEGVDILFAVDVSTSMLARDVKPNRLVRARSALADLVKTLEGNRVGLIAFAGDANVLCPLTLDYGAVRMFLDVLDPLAFHPQGTNVSAAIRKAFRAFGDRPDTSKVIILLTDGESHQDNPVEAAKEAAERGIVIHTVGIGNPQGAPIPVEGGGGGAGYKRDAKGEMVLSRLDEATLQEIARVTGGIYILGEGHIDVDPLKEAVREMAASRLDASLREQHKERYQWPLGFALLCFLAEALLPARAARKQPV